MWAFIPFNTTIEDIFYIYKTIVIYLKRKVSPIILGIISREESKIL